MPIFYLILIKMKIDDILEGNRLIAEFMDGKYYEFGTPNEMWIPYMGSRDFTTLDSGETGTLMYHSSWEWLMNVVEKIELLSEYRDIKVTISPTSTLISCYSKTERQDPWNYRLLYSRNAIDKTSKRNACWQSVVEFIKWYNENKPQ